MHTLLEVFHFFVQLFQGVQLEKQFPAEGIRTMQQYPVYLSGVFGQPEFQVNESPLHEYVATDQVSQIIYCCAVICTYLPSRVLQRSLWQDALCLTKRSSC